MERIQGNIKRKRQRQPEEEEGRIAKHLGRTWARWCLPWEAASCPTAAECQALNSVTRKWPLSVETPSLSKRAHPIPMAGTGVTEKCCLQGPLRTLCGGDRSGPKSRTISWHLCLRKRRLFPNQRTEKEFPVWWRSRYIWFSKESKTDMHYLLWCGYIVNGFSGGSEGKASACNAGDRGLTPGSGRFPGEETGNPLWYSCLENPMDGEACRRL